MDLRKIIVKFEGQSDNEAFVINAPYCSTLEIVKCFIQFLDKFYLNLH